MRKRGHIRVSRKMFDGHDPIWEAREPFDRRSAWIDLCQLANYRARQRIVNGAVVSLERGQLLASERFLAQRWRWTRAKVRRFMDALVTLQRIVQKPAGDAAHAGTVVTLCKYDEYNPLPTKTRPTGDTGEQPESNQREAKAEEGEERERRKGGARTRATALPASWEPNDSHRELATERGVDVGEEAEKFRDHAAANRRRQADWDASFRNWLRIAYPKRPSLGVVEGGGGNVDDEWQKVAEEIRTGRLA